MPKIKSKAVILVKIEATPNVDAAPVAPTDVVLVGDLSIEPSADQINLHRVKGSYGADEVLIVGQRFAFGFKAQVKGGGAAGDVPPVGAMLRACNMAETINAGVDVDYDPHSDPDGETVTIYFFYDGLLHKSTGCVGSVDLEAKAADVGTMGFKFEGSYGGVVDNAFPAAFPTEQKPPIFQNASFDIQGYAAVIESLKFDLSNEIARRSDANAADGIMRHFISGRNPSGGIDPEVVPLATQNFWDDWKNGAVGILNATIGSVVGNRLVISAPKVQYESLKYGERNTLLTYDLGLRLRPDSGNDELQLKYS